jgi:uncharacterized protein (TIGR02271 family)
MSKTVVGLFDGADQAQLVVQELKREGLTNTETYGSASGGGATGIQSKLTDAGVPGDEADLYADGIKSGGTLVLVRTDDTKATRAVEIMERHSSPGAQAGTAAPRHTGGITGKATSPGRAAGKEIRAQEVEEELRIGKRSVERTGARVSTHISERPVEKNINLHEEKVNVERRSVNRPATEADLRKGNEEFIVKERSEEPIVEKRARVVGEVVVSKESHDRQATVRDTVRRKDVHVDKEPGGTGTATGRGYSELESEFREHHRKHDKSGMDYNDAAPAYRYGADLAQGRRFKGKEWSGIKSDVKSDWDKYNPGTWSEAEPAIKFGWDKAHGKA